MDDAADARLAAATLKELGPLPDLDLDDIQGLIARGYPDLNAASYVLLQIDDAASARALARRARRPGHARARPARPTSR